MKRVGLMLKPEDKPILLDFTGWACVNCRKMEENVWSRPEVFRLLNEEFVIISLYVDDRKELPEALQFNFNIPTEGSNHQNRRGKVGDFSEPKFCFCLPALTMF